MIDRDHPCKKMLVRREQKATMEPTPRTTHAQRWPRGGNRRDAAPANSPPHFENGFASEREERRVLAWLNAGLRPHRPGRLQREYPFLFGAESVAIPITAYVDHRPAAFCVLWPAPFQVGSGTLRMGLLSLVYTAPAFRGRGYASQIVSRAMEAARERSLGCVALWSEFDTLYEGLGFVESGCETVLALDTEIFGRARFDATDPKETDGLEISAARVSDWNAIESLRAERACQRPLRLSPSALSAIPDMTVRVARRESRVVAFAMRGRGDDFSNVIHEWGGQAAAALLCCEALTGQEPVTRSAHLLSPQDRSDLTWRLRQAGAAVSRKALAWFQLADLEVFAADLAACLDRDLGWQIDALSPASRSIHVRSPVAEIEISLQSFLDACIGASSLVAESDALSAIAPLFVNEDAIPLPLPFYISGLESI